MNRSEFSFIIVALSRVDSEYSSTALSIAEELAKNHSVYYVNHPYTYKDLLKKVRKDTRLKKMYWRLLFRKIVFEKNDRFGFTSIVVPFVLPINWMPKSWIFDLLHRLNERVVKRSIKLTVRKYRLEKYIFINIFNPYYVGFLPKDFGQAVSIYQSVDNISQNSYTLKHGVRLEKQAVSKADIVFVTSTALSEKMKLLNERTHIIHNAADFTLFHAAVTKSARPADVQEITSRIIGYTGNIDDLRIDFQLLKEIALRNKDCTLLLVGPVNSHQFFQLGLDQIENIVSLGPKKIQELPDYLMQMDVLIIPFMCNSLTASIYPLKINEYLAVGKPVVSTRFSKDIESFEKVIEIGNSHTEIFSKIDEFLNQEPDETLVDQRIEVARNNTWASRVDQIWTHIEAYMK
ncbi:MAG: glycosyltransferase [Bacteroidota bacterium]